MKGAYIQPLEPRLERFEGTMGLFLRDRRIAFFRKYKEGGDNNRIPAGAAIVVVTN